jgi:pimeloyl-ACP methyl ester carboxylesterase
LNKGRRVLTLDLRGRGLSDKPDTGYGMADHAADVVGLLDALGLDQVVLGGHYFGGLLALCMAAKYPERFSKLVIIDASISWPSGTGDLLKPSLDRLDKVFASWDVYLNLAKGMPFLDGYWDPYIEEHYRADVEIREDGSVKPRTPSVLPSKNALETARLLTNGQYVKVPGNHLTMILGENAKKVVEEITHFVEM